MIGAPMSEPTVVYLVEDHTDPEPKSYTVYFAHVYLSRDKAKAGVEHWSPGLAPAVLSPVGAL